MRRSLIWCVTFLVMFLLNTSTMAGGNSDIAEEGVARVLLEADDGFACGQDLICDPTAQYCYVLIAGPKGVPTSYRCVGISAEGSLLTCETIPNIGIGCECTESDGGTTVTCTAP